MKKLSRKKRLLLIALSCCILISSTLGVLWYTLWRAPKTEDIYDRVVELVEASYELNTVFFGAGLPVYATDSEYADINHIYFDFEHKGNYELVTNYTKFASDQAIRDAAEKVYSKAYLEDVIYNNAFVGYAINDGTGKPAYSSARYLDDGEWLYQSTSGTDYIPDGMRIYDYSTMKVVAPSNAKTCYVEIDSYLPSEPSNILRARLRLVMQDDGQWYLDIFTG